MDLAQLQTQHPSLFAECVNVGMQEERDRVSAHIKMGKASGNIDYAVQCVEEGTAHGALVNAEHLTYQMNQSQIEDRGSEAPEAGGAAPVATVSNEAKFDEAVAAELATALRLPTS